MNDLKNFTLYTHILDDNEEINQQLVNGLNTYINQDTTRKSHHFLGRYENIYIDIDKIPALSLIIDAAIRQGAHILDCPAKELKAGLWFNIMNPGDKTTLHRHDDYDERLSAVYYVQVAENSGTLHLKKQPVDIQVTPKQGMFVFFLPDMPHEVSENLSQQCRISLGINIGPA
ncbi:MAG: 2OG-Fe(II) oxygenase family protein [Gammaproteobacteria bacterium]|nr:2OG-Fe(II) oxygenase family protein [Gammaproteobacteria bacterium]